MLEATLVCDHAELTALAEEWDALAVSNGLPQMTPSWVLSWWRNIAPAGAVPRTVAVRDGETLVGLAPFFAEPSAGGGRVDYRLPGIDLAARLSPLAAPGREWEVAAAVAQALAQATPAVDVVAFEGAPLVSPWPAALRAGWPGKVRPALHTYHLHGCPTMTLDADSFDGWLAGKSSNFRGQMRRLRRRFAAAGGTLRTSTAATLHDDVASFLRLHTSRWEGRGDSNLVGFGARAEAMLEDAGRPLLDSGRYRMLVMELDGAPVCVQLFLRAGDTLLYFNGGWDERFAAFKPSLIGLLDAVEHGYDSGLRTIDFGLGEQSYKLRFADGNAPVAWSILQPAAGPRYLLTRARTAPMLIRYRARDALKRSLTAEQADRLRGLRRRVTR